MLTCTLRTPSPPACQAVASDPAALEQITSAMRVSAEDMKQEVAGLLQKLAEQAEEIKSRQDRGPTRLIRHLTVRSLWREFCGPGQCGAGVVFGVRVWGWGFWRGGGGEVGGAG